ncbi:prephenate dehydrogenase [Riemerella anatipestifer]|uniref:Prephenate dehydrogenase n=1 Tax=Riemerella anatipestifer TaxID=34085 RepID=A0AAP3ARP7_RIEAN|nr:prephenate dehydrogenase [Riemerella anatipestifer]AZZ57722.1 prephenate dehydrogenase [Riemerella anatipestifer]MBT0572149.1 prephenate dehydrogenase [Riemerella anatipestifer]MCU7568635.1 prephenate dehydrogenase [Riemerella anatipestifer]MCW0490632.1 prephenate dehydrogenase [Riemerella anatipestifer]MCW0510983.1 prephenate dehydrogenase [Riemerella anatipestifer]
MVVGLIGVGLIGGSMALKLKSKNTSIKICGTDNSINHLNEALALGIIDEADDLENTVKKADLIIIAIPVDATQKILPNVLDLLDQHQTVMDTGSTKLGIVNAIKNHENRNRFVASHPMWGTENSGPKSAQLDSFSGRVAVLCDAKDSAKDAVEKVSEVYQLLEMNLVEMTSEQHDIHTAYISHISHITSYALANTVLEKEKEEDTIFQLASSGFSSTVRLAKSHPEMWVPIFKQNKENVLDVLNEHISQLRKFKAALEKENYDFLEELIKNANKIRGILK